VAANRLSGLQILNQSTQSVIGQANSSAQVINDLIDMSMS